jgi:hypothetical protein
MGCEINRCVYFFIYSSVYSGFHISSQVTQSNLRRRVPPMKVNEGEVMGEERSFFILLLCCDFEKKTSE